MPNSFFCIICNKPHEEQENGGYIFRTGFRFLDNGENVPLGICQEEWMKQELRN